MTVSKWTYYMSSIPTLITGVKNPFTVLWGVVRRQPFELRLRNGLKFRVRTLMDVWIIKETCLDRDYEVHGLPVQPGWTVIDVGAGLGDFTLFAARKARGGRVYAFEPFPESYALLRDNIRLNGIANVDPFPVAVNATGEPLYLQTQTGVAVRHATRAEGGEGAQTVKGMALADILAKTGRCDVLKMDCEGGEYDILLGSGADTLSLIQAIVMEYHDEVTPWSHHDLVRHLEACGFTTEATPNPVHPENGFLYAHRR